MTTTDTMDTMSTVEQSIRMIKAVVKLYVSPHRAKKMPKTTKHKRQVRSRGYDTPLVADIHFTNAAEIAAVL